MWECRNEAPLILLYSSVQVHFEWEHSYVGLMRIKYDFDLPFSYELCDNCAWQCLCRIYLESTVYLLVQNHVFIALSLEHKMTQACLDVNMSCVGWSV